MLTADTDTVTVDVILASTDKLSLAELQQLAVVVTHRIAALTCARHDHPMAVTPVKDAKDTVSLSTIKSYQEYANGLHLTFNSPANCTAIKDWLERCAVSLNLRDTIADGSGSCRFSTIQLSDESLFITNQYTLHTLPSLPEDLFYYSNSYILITLDSVQHLYYINKKCDAQELLMTDFSKLSPKMTEKELTECIFNHLASGCTHTPDPADGIAQCKAILKANAVDLDDATQPAHK